MSAEFYASELREAGYREVASIGHLRIGQRVRNMFMFTYEPDSIKNGTASIVRIFAKPRTQEGQASGDDVEVIVRRDDPDSSGREHGRWPEHHTVLTASEMLIADPRIEAAAEAMAVLGFPGEPDIWSGNSVSSLTEFGRENYRSQIRHILAVADKAAPVATTMQKVAAATEAIAKRMTWASVHWGNLDPEAYPILAAVAVEAADAVTHTQKESH